ERLTLAALGTTEDAHEVDAAAELGHGERDLLVTPAVDRYVLGADLERPTHVAKAASLDVDQGADLGAAHRLGQLGDANGRTRAMGAVDQAVAVVVATVVADLDAAGVAAAIAVRVALREVGNSRAVVAGIADKVAIGVLLVRVRDRWAVVAHVRDAV